LPLQINSVESAYATDVHNDRKLTNNLKFPSTSNIYNLMYEARASKGTQCYVEKKSGGSLRPTKRRSVNLKANATTLLLSI